MTQKTCWRTLRAFGLFLAVPAATFAANQAKNSDSGADASSASQGSHRSNAGSAQQITSKPMKLSRADDVLGRDVMASDGKKAGDIVDLVFDVEGQPRITHVLVMTGGFFDMGGDVRAVPVSALHVKDETCRIHMTADQFFRAPLVTTDRGRFFADATLVGSVDSYFHSQHGEAGQKSEKSTTAQSGSNSNDREQNSASAGKALGKPVLYTNLEGREVRGSGNGNLGTVTDAWINLPEQRVPLIEMRAGTAIGTPFEVNDRTVRYQVPTAKLENVESGQVNFDISARDIEQAPSVTAVEWANMSGDRYGSVIRLEASESEGADGAKEKRSGS